MPTRTLAGLSPSQEAYTLFQREYSRGSDVADAGRTPRVCTGPVYESTVTRPTSFESNYALNGVQKRLTITIMSTT